MRKVTRSLFAISTLMLAGVLAGCGGGTTFGVTVRLATSPSPAVDQGQVVTVTATILNDNSGKGVTWSLSGLGSLTNQTSTSVTYVAPATVTTHAKVTVTAISVADTKATASTAIEISPPPSITTTSLPSGTAGTCYGQTSTSSGVTCNGEALSESGGTPPYTWGVTAGQIPPGLSLNSSSGLVTGTPTTPGTYSATIVLTDSVGLSAKKTIGITIAPPPTLTVSTTALPTAAINVSYSATLSATGGVAPYQWGLSSGSASLPQGLVLSPSGVISGIPSVVGTYSFTVQVTDSEGPSPATATQTLTLIVNPHPFSITTTALPNGTVNIAYSTTLQASGPPSTTVNWTTPSGGLPPWATLTASTGVISGNPNAAGTTSFVVTATDSDGDTATQTLSITISLTTDDALVNGQYAFSLGGYAGGLVGSFTADGSGHITSGSEDLENGITPLSASNIAITSGLYTIGADNRGVLSYTDANGHTYTFDLALSAGSSSTGASTGGAMIETDTSGNNFTGSFALQNPSAFSSSALTGTYAFGFSGWDSGQKPDVVVGSAAVSSGSVSSGLLDENDGGITHLNVSFTGTLSVSSSGRGTITSSAAQASFTFYVISTDQWFAISYNPSTGAVRTGLVEQQTGGPYSNASINGTMVLQSQSSTSAPAPQAEVGLLTSAGDGTANTSLDVDAGGTLGTQSDSDTLDFTSTTNGRFTATPQTSEPFVGYMIAPNQAFIAGTGATASFGTFEPQVAGPFQASSLNGAYFLESLPLVAAPPGGLPPTVSSGQISFDAVVNLTGTIDSSSAGAPTTSELTTTYSVASNGRVSITSGKAILYIVSSGKMVILSAGLANSTNPMIEIAQR